MKRLCSIFTALLFAISLSTNTVFATENNTEDVFISTTFVAEANCRLEQLGSGENVIILSRTRALEQAGAFQNYETTTVSIFPDSEAETSRLIEDIYSVKRIATTRGSGSYTDEGWYYGSSVCVTSTLNYYTTKSQGITYGGLTSVYVKCSVSNSTILDDISLRIHQEGYTDNDGRKIYDVTYDINNWSTTNAPSSWLGVYWENGVGSLVGARVTITVHRGTSKQYTYSLVNNIIE